MTQADWMNIFGDNLVDILEEKGMTQSQLAEDAGLSVSRISDYINKRSFPSLQAAINLAYALDMDINELVDFGDRVY